MIRLRKWQVGVRLLKRVRMGIRMFLLNNLIISLFVTGVVELDI